MSKYFRILNVEWDKCLFDSIRNQRELPKDYSNFSNTFTRPHPYTCVWTVGTLRMHWCSTNSTSFVLTRLQVLLFSSTKIPMWGKIPKPCYYIRSCYPTQRIHSTTKQGSEACNLNFGKLTARTRWAVLAVLSTWFGLDDNSKIIIFA